MRLVPNTAVNIASTITAALSPPDGGVVSLSRPEGVVSLAPTDGGILLGVVVS